MKKDYTVGWFVAGLVTGIFACICVAGFSHDHGVWAFVEPPSDCNTRGYGSPAEEFDPYHGTLGTNGTIALDDSPDANVYLIEDEDSSTMTFSPPDPNDTAVFASPDAIAFCTIDGSLLFTPAWNSDTEQPGYQISRQAIQILAKSGRICDVLGHNWRDGRPGEVDCIYADIHPNTWYRTCRICGKCEKRSLGDWK